jgi:hypothetical protein
MFLVFPGDQHHDCSDPKRLAQRSYCPQVTLALVLDASGIPKRSEVFAGHVSEPKTLEKMSLTSRPNRSADGGA